MCTVQVVQYGTAQPSLRESLRGMLSLVWVVRGVVQFVRAGRPGSGPCPIAASPAACHCGGCVTVGALWGRCVPRFLVLGDFAMGHRECIKRFQMPNVCFQPSCPQPLSIMMTTASTLMAIATTPLLTTLLVGWVDLWVWTWAISMCHLSACIPCVRLPANQEGSHWQSAHAPVEVDCWVLAPQPTGDVSLRARRM